jgi:uncharacterized membrane protein (UPF0127 family)
MLSNLHRRQKYIGLVLVVLAVLAFAASRLSQSGEGEVIEQGFIPTVARFERTGASLALEVATSTEARTLGLSGRKALADNTALLMIFSEDGEYGIWMKDMLFSIDVLWIDARGRVVDLVERFSPETYPQAFIPSRPVRYVIEAPAGFIPLHGIVAGERVQFD